MKNYFKRVIELYKEDKLLSQIFMRIKSVYSLAPSNQKKWRFDRNNFYINDYKNLLFHIKTFKKNLSVFFPNKTNTIYYKYTRGWYGFKQDL